MSIQDARDGLQRAALAYAADRTTGNERALDEAAADFGKARLAAASGETAATFQAQRNDKLGVFLCPSCRAEVINARRGTTVRVVDAKTFQPHFCRRRT